MDVAACMVCFTGTGTFWKAGSVSVKMKFAKPCYSNNNSASYPPWDGK